MELNEGLSLLGFIKDQEQDSLLFQRWIVGAQYQMSFEEFKLQLTPKPDKPEKEILADVEKILTSFGGESNGNI